MTSFSRAGRLAFWLEPISTLTNGARATRSGWLTMTAGWGPANSKEDREARDEGACSPASVE